MSGSILPVVCCVFAWWLGTGLVLRLDQLPDGTFTRNRVRFTLLAAVVLVALIACRDTTSVWSAYFGFIAAVVLWGWLEFLHYSGYLIGPRVSACPPDLTWSRRFVYAFQAMAYRELSVALLGIALLLLTWDSPNQVVLYTYCVLWVMRISAELNVFMGVGYLPEQWLPEKLKYLMTYRSRRTISVLFPLSVTLAGVVCAAIFLQLPPSADAFGHTSGLLIGTLLCLAIIEHLLLVLPNNGTALWSWALSSRAACKAEL